MTGLRTLLNRIASRQDSLESRLFWFISYASVIVEILCIAIDILNGNGCRLSAVLGAAAVLTVFNGMYCYRSKRFLHCYSVLICLINFLVLPASFLICGGYLSGIPVYMAFGLILCAVHPNAKSRFLTFLFSSFAFAALFRYVTVHPEAVRTIPGESLRLSQICAVAENSVAVIILLSFLISEIRDIDKHHVREYEKKTRMRMDLLESQTENIEEAKYQRNQMRRHNMIITEFAEKGDMEGLAEYLSEKKRNDEKYNKKQIYCMNSTINSVLEIYARMASNSRIPLQINADVGPEVRIPDPELVSLVSNILENAVTGAEKSGVSEKRVSVDIRTKDGKLILICRNTCRPNIDLSGGYPGHPGIGIDIVEKILHKHGGLLNYQMDNGVIQCRLVINMGEL